MLAMLVLLAEAVLGAAIVLRVPYTEIDWVAYMQEVGGWWSGEMDYTKLGGDTGPLVYPAGFLYIYSGLRWVTSDGVNILLGQWIFLGLYLVLTALALAVYKQAASPRLPPWIVLLLIPTKRVHSIFMLRLFNDGIASLIMFAAILVFAKRKWSPGCIIFSLALSVKMNILLFVPAIGILMLRDLGIWRTIPRILLCVIMQLVIGAPFLATYPVSYLSRAFELSRVFFYKWTVNFKFLPEDVFIGKPLAAVLLAATAVVMLLFVIKWSSTTGGLWSLLRLGGRGDQPADSPRVIVLLLFTSQFIGVVFSRTLHYQFYSWYFHTLPLLAFSTPLPLVVKLACLAAIEVAFNVFPATAWSSALLQVAHLVLLAGLYLAPTPLQGEHQLLAEWNSARSGDTLRDAVLRTGVKNAARTGAVIRAVGVDTWGVDVVVNGRHARLSFAGAATTLTGANDELKAIAAS